jgi:hypothetical protein
MRISKEDYSCLGKHLNLVYIKRDIIFSYMFNHDHHNNNRKNHKSLMITYFYNGLLIHVLTHVIIFIGMIFMCGLH